MQNKIVIIPDLKKQKKAFDIIYKILSKDNIVSTFITIEDARISNTVNSIKLNEIRNSIIILMKDIKNYYEIDRSNKVIYLATGKSVNYLISFMLPRIDMIIGCSNEICFKLFNLCKQAGLNTPVYKINPIISINNKELIGEIGIINKADIAKELDRLKLKYSTYNSLSECDSSVIIYNGDYDMEISSKLLNGAIIITQNSVNSSEFIVNKVNGYLYDSNDEIINYILNDHEKIKSTLAFLQYNYDETFLKDINNIIAGNKLSINQSIEYQFLPIKKWIIQSSRLVDETEKLIPSTYNRNSFKILNEHDLESILVFLSSQQFKEIYIFEWDYGNINKIERIHNLIRSLGNRINNIYWCTDDNIKTEWVEVWDTMTILPTSEGIKRVNN